MSSSPGSRSPYILQSPPVTTNQSGQATVAVEQNPTTVELRNFLANAPRLWTSPNDAPVRKFKMGNGEEISCVFWKGRFFITGTDVVKILIFRFQQLGRGILNPKKFEEGVFSDLRNLKPGTEAVLEEPRSEFLEFLHKHGCIRTQKKQKVFFWNKVPHDDLFREALERNLKRVTNVFNWTQMMSSPDIMKQYMMMQAAAAANGQIMMPSPVMMPGQLLSPQYHQHHQHHIGGGGGQHYAPMNGVGVVHPGMVASTQFNSPIESPTMIPSPQIAASEVKTHPRRTISLSAVDFSPRPTHSNPASSTQSIMSPGIVGDLVMPADISSALSSPLFSPDVDINDSFFDIPELIPSKLGGDPVINGTIAPSDLLRDDPTAPEPSMEPIMENNNRLDSEVIDALSGGLKVQSSELIIDPTLGGDLTGGDLLADLWPSSEKTSAVLNSPLWDDLSMLMPNMAPNLRDP